MEYGGKVIQNKNLNIGYNRWHNEAQKSLILKAVLITGIQFKLSPYFVAQGKDLKCKR